MPTGLVNAGEDVSEAAAREVLEVRAQGEWYTDQGMP